MHQIPSVSSSSGRPPHKLLTRSLRTQDPWLEAVLEADRYGKESWEMYCFIHGLPTRNLGSWLPAPNTPMCGNERCLTLAQEVVNASQDSLSALIVPPPPTSSSTRWR